jgi:hypothetical protein
MAYPLLFGRLRSRSDSGGSWPREKHRAGIKGNLTLGQEASSASISCSTAELRNMDRSQRMSHLLYSIADRAGAIAAVVGRTKNIAPAKKEISHLGRSTGPHPSRVRRRNAAYGPQPTNGVTFYSTAGRTGATAAAVGRTKNIAPE